MAKSRFSFSFYHFQSYLLMGFSLFSCRTSEKQAREDLISYLTNNYQQQFVIDSYQYFSNAGNGFINQHLLSFHSSQLEDTSYSISLTYDEEKIIFSNDAFFKKRQGIEHHKPFTQFIESNSPVRVISNISFLSQKTYANRQDLILEKPIVNESNPSIYMKFLVFQDPNENQEELLRFVQKLLMHYVPKSHLTNIWMVFPQKSYYDMTQLNDIYQSFEDKVNVTWSIELNQDELIQLEDSTAAIRSFIKENHVAN